VLASLPFKSDLLNSKHFVGAAGEVRIYKRNSTDRAVLVVIEHGS
jgi:hypothetical protein